MKHPSESILRTLLDSLSACSRRSSRTGRLLRLPRPEADYTQALERSASKLRERQAALARERSEACRRLAELAEHRPEQQPLVLCNDPRFHTWGVLEALLEQSQEILGAARAESERIAGLAVRLADRLDPDYYGEPRLDDLRARAWSTIAEARRLRSDFAGAGDAFDRAHEHLRTGTGDALERALVLDLEASLRCCERRFEEARRLLREALEIFVENGEDQRAAQVLIHLAAVHRSAGRGGSGAPHRRKGPGGRWRLSGRSARRTRSKGAQARGVGVRAGALS